MFEEADNLSRGEYGISSVPVLLNAALERGRILTRKERADRSDLHQGRIVLDERSRSREFDAPSRTEFVPRRFEDVLEVYTSPLVEDGFV